MKLSEYKLFQEGCGKIEKLIMSGFLLGIIIVLLAVLIFGVLMSMSHPVILKNKIIQYTDAVALGISTHNDNTNTKPCFLLGCSDDGPYIKAVMIQQIDKDTSNER